MGPWTRVHANKYDIKLKKSQSGTEMLKSNYALKLMSNETYI